MKKTTIKIDQETKTMLDSFKIHPRQSYEEIIGILITHCKEAIKQNDFELFKRHSE